MFCYSSIRFSATKCYCICSEKWRRVTSRLLCPLDQIYNKKTDTGAFCQTCSETKWCRQRSSHSRDEMTKLIIFLTNPPHVQIPPRLNSYVQSQRDNRLGGLIFSSDVSAKFTAHTVNPLAAAPLPRPSQPTSHSKPYEMTPLSARKH